MEVGRTEKGELLLLLLKRRAGIPLAPGRVLSPWLWAGGGPWAGAAGGGAGCGGGGGGWGGGGGGGGGVVGGGCGLVLWAGPGGGGVVGGGLLCVGVGVGGLGGCFALGGVWWLGWLVCGGGVGGGGGGGGEVLMSPTAMLMIHNPATFIWG